MNSEGRMPFKQRFVQFMIAFDQMAGAVVGLFHRRGAWADETLSARCWREHEDSKGWNAFRIFVDTLFFWQKDHCRHAYESERLREHMSVVYRKVQ